MPLQSKLLRFAESGEFRSLGSNQIRRSNCRIISASNRALRPLMAAGGFRSDLFFRLAGFEILVPALRERGGDASLIAQELLSSLSQGRLQLSTCARAALDARPFPGNVRELRNVVSYAITAGAGATRIDESHLPAYLNGESSAPPANGLPALSDVAGRVAGLPGKPAAQP